MIELNVKIADEIMHVIFYSAYTEDRLAEYSTDDKADFTVCPKRADKERIRDMFREAHKETGVGEREHTYGFNEFHAIHLELAKKLVERGVLLVHGSVVVAGGGAYMFIAPSGTGKSTHTRYWTEVLGERSFIINDDKPLIRVTDGEPLVYPTPWGNEEKPKQADKAPLKALILLERADFNKLTPINDAELFPHLYKASLRGETPAEVIRIVELERKLMKQVGLYRMQCTNSIEAAETAIGELKVER